MRPFAPTVCIKLLTCEIRTSYGGNIKGAVASTSTNLAAARPATRIEPDAGGYVAAMTNAFRVVWSTAAIGRKRQDDFACALSATHLFPLLTPAAEMVVGRFSNRPFWVKRLSDYPPLQCRCLSRARASLRTRHQGPSIMGVEDEVEQSFGRPCRQTDGRSKRPNELTSSIVPRGTSFHRSVELEVLLS